MIAGVQPRTFLALPRRAWQTLKAKSVKPEVREERKPKVGLMDAFEQMLSYQVNLAFREYDK